MGGMGGEGGDLWEEGDTAADIGRFFPPHYGRGEVDCPL